MVVVVGSLNADIIVPVDRLPVKGETVVARDDDDAGKVFCGGKGANQVHESLASRKIINSSARMLMLMPMFPLAPHLVVPAGCCCATTWGKVHACMSVWRRCPRGLLGGGAREERR